MLITLLCCFLSFPAFAGKAGLLASGEIGENLTGGVGDYDIHRTTTFNGHNREVLWFVAFKGFMTAYKANLKAVWIEPSGEIFKTEKFSTVETNSRFGWTKLDISGADKKALDFVGEWTVKIYWDDELIDTDKFKITETQEPSQPEWSPVGKSVHVLLNNSIVYEGPDQSDPTAWNFKKVSFNNLKVSGLANASKSLAILVYPYSLDLSSSGWTFDRGKYMANEIKKTGFKPLEIIQYDTLPEQYGYVLRYNLARKSVETNFLTENGSVAFNLIDYSEQSQLVRNAAVPYGNGHFPHDLSGKVAQRIADRLTNDEYRVVDLSPSRDDLAGKSLDEIMQMAHDKYAINQILFVPINAFTKWTWDFGSSKQTEIGLLLCYSAILFERGASEPIFTFTDNIDLGENHVAFLSPMRKELPGRRINFYSEDWSEDRKIHPDRPVKFYKDGIFDDTWAASVVLEKFGGTQMFSVKDAKLVHVGGDLFEKLHESGFLPKVEQQEIQRAKEEGSDYVIKKADLLDSEGGAILRLFSGASCKILQNDGEKNMVEVVGVIHKYDIENDTNDLIKIKKDSPRFLWPKSWIKNKSDCYYLSQGQIARKEIKVGKDINVLAKDDDFLTISIKGYIDQKSTTHNFNDLSKAGNITGTIVRDGQPASKVEVRISDTDWVKTDDAGRYKAENLKPGKEYKLYIKTKEGYKTQTYVSLINLPVLEPGESLVYSPVDLAALENSNPEDEIAVISDGYVSEKNGLTGMLPKFVPLYGSVDHLLSAEMTIKAASGFNKISKDTVQEDLKKIGKL